MFRIWDFSKGFIKGIQLSEAQEDEWRSFDFRSCFGGSFFGWEIVSGF